MIQLFQEIWAIIVAIWNTGNRWARWAIAVFISWPLMMVHFSIFFPAFVPYVTLFPLFAIAILFIAWLDPLVVAAIATFSVGRRALRWLLAIIVVELMIGIYLSVVPIIKKPGLLPILILVVIAIAFIRLSPIKTKWVRTILYALVVIITLGFWLPNTMEALKEKPDKWDKKWAESVREETPKPSVMRGATQKKLLWVKLREITAPTQWSKDYSTPSGPFKIMPVGGDIGGDVEVLFSDGKYFQLKPLEQIDMGNVGGEFKLRGVGKDVVVEVYEPKLI